MTNEDSCFASGIAQYQNVSPYIIIYLDHVHGLHLGMKCRKGCSLTYGTDAGVIRVSPFLLASGSRRSGATSEAKWAGSLPRCFHYPFRTC